MFGWSAVSGMAAKIQQASCQSLARPQAEIPRVKLWLSKALEQCPRRTVSSNSKICSLGVVGEMEGEQPKSNSKWDWPWAKKMCIYILHIFYELYMCVFTLEKNTQNYDWFVQKTDHKLAGWINFHDALSEKNHVTMQFFRWLPPLQEVSRPRH